MSVEKNRLGNISTQVYGRIAVASRRADPKTPGTRAGTLQDWRQGSGKSGKRSGRRGNTLRDGR